MKGHSAERNVRTTLFFSVFLLLFASIEGQEVPFFNTPTWEANVTHRNNLCYLHGLVEDGQILRRNALHDVDIRPALFRYQLDKETGGIPETNPSVGLVFLDELARRAKFQWRNSYGVVESPGENQTWSELLDWSIDTYDVVGDWFLRTVERLGDGILFPEGWYAGSLIMVNRKEEKESEFRWNSFLAPFTWAVWLMIGGTIIVSGLVYAALEWVDNKARTAQKERIDVFEGMFRAASALSNSLSGDYPTTSPSRIAALSTSFLFLLIVTAYTANLASFLIVQNTPALVINVIQDAIKNDLRFCVLTGSTSETYLTKEYPSARMVQKGTIGDTYLAIDRGECDLVLTTVGTWELKRRDIIYNGDCQKQWVGRVVSFTTAGFTIGDSAELCTSLLRDVLNLHMLEMKIDGTFDTIWDTYYEKSTTNNCFVGDDSSSADNDIGSLTVKEVGGIFIVHLFALAFAFALSLFQWFRRSRSKSDSSLKSTQKLNSSEHVSGGNNSVGSFPNKEDDDVSSQLQELRTEMNEQLQSMMRQGDRQRMEVIETVKGQMEEMQEHISAFVERESTKKDLTA
jgi:ABC-type amino acid transport substrate-binding protein